jgi:hypothetical protein
MPERVGQLAITLDPTVKEALKRAARRLRRSMTSQASIILVEWLIANKFLKNGSSRRNGGTAQ